MKSENELNGPIILGGVGGSGTRIITKILNNLGVYMGFDLNEPLDNLTFTLLFKRPNWFYTKDKHNPDEIYDYISLFEKIMLNNNNKFSIKEIKYLISATLKMSKSGHNYLNNGNGIWPWVRLYKILFKNSDNDKNIMWGWKEPNSQIYIKYLNNYFKRFKYVHIIRNGLDMAFSKNQQQLYNWSNLFDIKLNKKENFSPKKSLDYWIKSNKYTIRYCENNLKENQYIIIKFENMCDNPNETIKKISDFLDINYLNRNTINKLASMIKKPDSIGRYKNHNLNIFTKKQLNELKQIGYNIKNNNLFYN